MAKTRTPRRRVRRPRQPNSNAPYPGPSALFRPKLRKPVTLTMTEGHHDIVDTNMDRLKLSRADYFGLLVERHGKTVQLTDEEKQRLGRA